MNGLCSCRNPVVSNPKPPCQKDNCLLVQNIYIPLVDAPYPCNNTLTINLVDKIQFNPKDDLGKLASQFTITSMSSNLTNPIFNVSVDRSSIELVVTTNYSGYPAPDYNYGKISYAVRQGVLSDEGTITIPFKSHCNTINIPNDKYCDPCTGDLISIPVDISVEESLEDNTPVNISIQ